MDCRRSFWDTVEDEYEVDMSCLVSVAREDLTRRLHVTCADPQSIVAHACKVTSLDLNTVQSEELKNLQVSTCS